MQGESTSTRLLRRLAGAPKLIGMRRGQAGVTLVELMMVVAVIAILALVALPSFSGETRKAKASSEVHPMFADLRLRLEQHMQERGRYPATIGEATLHPAGPPAATARPINPPPAAWQAIKVRITGSDAVYCGYTWASGRAGDGANIGPEAAARFGYTAPATDWYYLLAKCDMDGDPSAFSWYFASSADPTIRKVDEGR